MERIIDEKTCMLRLGPTGHGENNRWKYLTDTVREGKDIPGESLEEWFKRRTIDAADFNGEITREQHLLIKAAYGMLQVACLATDGSRVGVFLRQKKEKPTGVKKITSGYSILRCWSPHSTGAKEVQADFVSRTGFRTGAPLDIVPYGVGFNEVLEGPLNMGSGYLFMVYKAMCTDADFPRGNSGATSMKSGEKFIGFFDPRELYEGTAKHNKKTICFEGRMDNLVLRSLANGERTTHSGVLATFNQGVWISGGQLTFATANNDSETRWFLAWVLDMCKKHGIALVQSALYDILKFGVVYSSFLGLR